MRSFDYILLYSFEEQFSDSCFVNLIYFSDLKNKDTLVQLDVLQ